MTAPLLGVSVPDVLGRQLEGYAAAAPGGSHLAVLLQAFDDVRAQTCIAGLCDLYAGAGVRLVAVEAAEGPVQPSRGRTDIAQLIGSEQVSAGALSVLNGGRVTVDVWGVDDLTAVATSHQAMMRVSAARVAREAVFAQIRTMLLVAQKDRYTGALAELRRARLGVYGERASISHQALLVRDAARLSGLDLSGFPLVERFLTVSEKEKSVDAARAARQQEEFVRRVTGRVHGWYSVKGKNEIQIDLEKAAPVLAYWLEETGQTLEEFTGTLGRADREAAFLACKEWFDGWFSVTAAQGASHAFYEALMRLALRLGIQYFDLRDFRESVALARDAETLKSGLDDEMMDVADALVNTDSGIALRDVEERLDVVYRMLSLAVPPRDAEARVAQITTLADIVAELASLPSARERVETPSAADVAALEPALESAREFLVLSRQRSEHMVARTLELIGDRREDRAILVVGGFHSRAVRRALEDYPDVSWSIIMPQVDVDAAWRAHRQLF